MNRLPWIVPVLLLSVTSPAFAQTWGDLKIQFKVTGGPIIPKPLVIDKDQAVCGIHKLVDESLVVGPQGELANVFVYLVAKAGEKVPVCPELPASNPQVNMDNVNCRYAPHALVMQTSQKLVIGNKDPLGHNSKGSFINNLEFNDLIPGSNVITKTFKNNENLPGTVLCSIHPWMSGYVLVRDNPYAAISDAKGVVTIPQVPVGTWTFALWHEGKGYIGQATAGGKPLVWNKDKEKQKVSKGRTEIAILATGTDLGVVEIPLAAVQK